jgi:diaminopimelate decarboxylase
MSKPELRFDLGRVKVNADRFVSSCKQWLPNVKTQVYFAVKAHPARVVLEALSLSGVGFEVTNSEQLQWARSLGIPYIASGFFKPREFLREACKDADYVVIETPNEIERIMTVASELKKTVNALVRIKVKPEAKLGCDIESIKGWLTQPDFLNVFGLHFHLGWNVKDDESLVKVMASIRNSQLALKGTGGPLKILNCGGSFCEHAANPKQLEHRLSVISNALDGDIQEVHFEPGRYLVGDAGTLIARIEHVDECHREIYLNSCAYAHKMTGATLRVNLLSGGVERSAGAWTLYGVWPSEGDKAEAVEILGMPRTGEALIIENVGAYSIGLERQLSVEHLVDVTYVNA